MKEEMVNNTSLPADAKKISPRDLRAERIRSINDRGLTVRGRREYLAYLNGERITLRQAVAAHCYDCQGFFADGRAPCPDELCPLWPWSQFNDKKPRRTMVITRTDGASYEPNGQAPDRLDVTKTGDQP